VDNNDLTLSHSQISCMTFDANWGPRSDITCLGRPVCLQTCLIYSCAVSSAVMVLLQGARIVALLSRLTTTNSELYPFDSGRSTMKSMVMIPQISVGIWFGCNGTRVCGQFFVDWHMSGNV
jgi:hypothetical protein